MSLFLNKSVIMIGQKQMTAQWPLLTLESSDGWISTNWINYQMKLMYVKQHYTCQTHGVAELLLIFIEDNIG